MKLFYSNTIPTRRGVRCGIKDLEDGEYCVSKWCSSSYYYKRVGNDLYHHYGWDNHSWAKETTNKYPSEDSSPVEIIDEIQVPTPCPYV